MARSARRCSSTANAVASSLSVNPPYSVPVGHFRRVYHRFAYDRDRFDADYHKRSNVETTFSMVKRKFGDSLRGRTTTAQDNEVLTKLIAHNLCRLVHAHYELGITPDLATGTIPKPATPVGPERHLRVVR